MGHYLQQRGECLCHDEANDNGGGYLFFSWHLKAVRQSRQPFGMGRYLGSVLDLRRTDKYAMALKDPGEADGTVW